MCGDNPHGHRTSQQAQVPQTCPRDRRAYAPCVPPRQESPPSSPCVPNRWQPMHPKVLRQAPTRQKFDEMGHFVRKSWELNKALDIGTNPMSVEAIIRKVHDFCLGYKLPGAGGGGYLYMVAKSPEAAVKIRQILTQEPPNACARFVEMTMSGRGLQVSRS